MRECALEHGTRSAYTEGCRCDECRAANTAYFRARRAANPDARFGEGRERRARRLAMVRDLKGTICRDCGETFEPDRLHFHHIEGTASRSFKIGHWHKGIKDHSTVESLLAEVEKCVVLCHRCHFARHRVMRAEGSDG